MSRLFLTGAAMLVDGQWLRGHGLLIENGRIAAILPEAAQTGAAAERLPPECLLSSGLIDIQVNGGGGVLFNDQPTQEGAREIAAAHRRLGTTAILPTLITDSPDVMMRAADIVAEPDRGLLGLHFEGPFISRDKPGVHPVRHIRSPLESDLVLLERLGRSRPGRVLLTLAPETIDEAAIRRLAAAGVVMAAGHSIASAERMDAALSAGVTGFTHLFNAMPPLAARSPGLAGVALTDPASYVGVIADGIHVHPRMLRLLLAAKPKRTILVSDAMPPTGTDITEFELHGRMIHREGGSLRTADGTLAGADICLADAVRTCVHVLGMPIAAALYMASAAPADFMGLAAETGRIALGLRADLVLFGGDLGVLRIWVGGKETVLF